MPSPDSTYQKPATAMSVQLSQPPQATGTAASRARNGTTTKAQRATRMPRDWWPWVSGFGPVAFGSVKVVDIAPPSGTGHAYVTVTAGFLDHTGERRSWME